MPFAIESLGSYSVIYTRSLKGNGTQESAELLKTSDERTKYPLYIMPENRNYDDYCHGLALLNFNIIHLSCSLGKEVDETQACSLIENVVGLSKLAITR